MIGRTPWRSKEVHVEEPVGFDAFDLRLGDLMRGERATLGKSLLDVQRELKIKAAYIAAIENADPSAFETPGFIAGYVRSYARYLGMDPEWAFSTFCAESGFQTTHGMSPAASAVKQKREQRKPATDTDMFASPTTPFVPAGEAFLSRVEPGAVGSVLVLLALIGGLGYGGWTVLQEVQRVQFAPVEQAPTVVAEVDPLAGGAALSAPGSERAAIGSGSAPSPEALDRLYRPQALDVPVMVARDAPISTLSPSAVGALVAGIETDPAQPASAYAALATSDPIAAALAEATGSLPATDESAEVAGLSDPAVPALSPSGVQVTQDPTPAVELVAVRTAWVRVTGPDGSTIYERIMEPGDTYVVPQTEEPARLRIGESGAVYFAVNGQHYGPVGPNGSVSSNVALSADALRDRYEVADLNADNDLAEWVRVAQARQVGPADEAPASE
ncbi:RodZ domain-containing protein [Histidinibacterium lentulum]|uniref:DUF4115 domain-containing protein n=1 Tax=Histidinibacterium lentulum TaxID=2480588 RepID=A0A3N2R8Y9_9RHOB|nr:RodZ domain-containing protein [Histidinibacterium lentulum]ROU03940.1 DUF4115 domain-containing protein [Histidinibacterium lentulum]